LDRVIAGGRRGRLERCVLGLRGGRSVEVSRAFQPDVLRPGGRRDEQAARQERARDEGGGGGQHGSASDRAVASAVFESRHFHGATSGKRFRQYARSKSARSKSARTREVYLNVPACTRTEVFKSLSGAELGPTAS